VGPSHEAAYRISLHGEYASIATFTGDPVLNKVAIRRPSGILELAEKLSRYEQLLRLPQTAPSLPVQFEFAEHGCEDASFDKTPSETRFTAGQIARLRIQNQTEVPLYIYIVALSRDRTIRLLDPPRNVGLNDTPIIPDRCYEPVAFAHSRVHATEPGLHHLLLIASSKALPSLHLLEQEGLTGAFPLNPARQLAGEPGSQQRGAEDGSVPLIWSAKLLDFDVSCPSGKNESQGGEKCE
jgi:hypothetical protein